MEAIMDITIRQQAQQMLDQLPSEGLEELGHYIEYLRFKYRLISPATPAPLASMDQDISSDSLTARFQGFVQSPLSVVELTTAYELSMMGNDE